MFDKFLSSLMRDNNNKVLMLLVLIVYIFGVTDLIPDKIRVNMKCPLGKLVFFMVIGVLSSNNFEMAILVTLIYLSTISFIKKDFENFTISINDRNKIDVDMYQSMKNINPKTNKSWYSENDGIISNDDKNIYKNITKSIDTQNGVLYDGSCVNSIVNTSNEIQSQATNYFNSLINSEEKVNKEFSSRCGENLIEVSKCSVNNNDEYENEENVIPACAAAYGYLEKRICNNVDATGRCLDNNNNILANCDTYDKIMNNRVCKNNSTIKPVLQNDVNGNQLKSFTLDEIKNKYLKIEDLTKPIPGELQSTGTFEMKNNKFLYFVNNLEKPSIDISNESNIPMKKLLDNYQYEYTWNSPNSEKSTVNIIIRNLTDNTTLKLDNVNPNNTEVFDSNMFVYKRNPEGNLVNAQNEVVTSVTEAVIKRHPDFQFKVEIKKPVYEIVDLYTLINKFDIPFDNNSIDNSLLSNDFDPDKYEKYKTYYDEYIKKKENWEQNTTKNIMRSIGCHRLRSDSSKIGYWGYDDTSNVWKCLEKEKPGNF